MPEPGHHQLLQLRAGAARLPGRGDHRVACTRVIIIIIITMIIITGDVVVALEAGLAGEVDQLAEVVVLLGEDGDLPLERHDQGLAGVLGRQGLEEVLKVTIRFTKSHHYSLNVVKNI